MVQVKLSLYILSHTPVDRLWKWQNKCSTLETYMGVPYYILSSQGLGIIGEEEREWMQETEMVDFYKEIMFSELHIQTHSSCDSMHGSVWT